jgi:hypothetical protein
MKYKIGPKEGMSKTTSTQASFSLGPLKRHINTSINDRIANKTPTVQKINPKEGVISSMLDQK